MPTSTARRSRRLLGTHEKPDGRGRQADPGRGARDPLPVARAAGLARPRARLARTDGDRRAGQSDRRRLGRCRAAAGRSAAGHRRRPAVADPEFTPGRRGDRLDAAGPVADRRTPRGRPVQQDQRAGARDHREYGDLRLPALRRGIAPVRHRRRRSRGGRDGRAVSRPAAAVAGHSRSLRRRQPAGAVGQCRSRGVRTPSPRKLFEAWNTVH